MKQEALKLALEFLEDNQDLIEGHERPEYLAMYERAISAVRKALEQEPCDMGDICIGCSPRNADGSCPSSQRTWVGLTDEKRSHLVTLHHGWNEYGKAIEAELKELNK
jgi:hypothetical protein